MTTNFIATINGLWTPGTIGPISPDFYGETQLTARQATRELLGLTTSEIGFYLVSRDTVGRVRQSRWRLIALAGGPSLRPGTVQPHDSQISLTLKVEPHGDLQQVVYGEGAETMPYRGAMSGVVAALLLRNRWGLSEREITVGQHGTGVFTPLELAYSGMYGDATVTADYEASGLTGYKFIAPAGSSPVPTMWLATDDASWPVSYCVTGPTETVAQRWDEPDDVVPEYAPLPEPAW